MWRNVTVMVFMLLFSGVALAQTPTPTPTAIPVVVTVQRSEMYSLLATASYNVNNMPRDVSNSNGTSLLPNTDARNLVGYAKWLFSPNSTQELLGRTFAPIGNMAFVLLGLIVILTGIYLAVLLVVYIIKFIVWFVTVILKFIPFIP